DRASAGRRDPPLGRPGPGGVAAPFGVRRDRDRRRCREGPGGLPRGARDAEGGAREVSETRADRLAALVAERELDLLLVGDLVRPGDSGRDAIANLRWLTGFSGTSGLALVGEGERSFVTDFRYVERAGREVSGD